MNMGTNQVMTSPIECTQIDNIASIVMRRPEKKNALTQEMYASLNELILASEQNPDIRAIVLSGANGNFTSGNDLSDFINVKKADDLQPVLSLLHTLANINKPLFAAVEGVAVGIGTTVLLHCDFAYAHQQAIFQTPFTRLGLCPEAAASYLMPKTIGYKQAARFLMLSEKVNADDAKQMGLITDIVDSPLDHAIQQAKIVSGYPEVSIKLTKSLLRNNMPSQKIESIIDKEAAYFFQCLQDSQTQAHIATALNGRK